MPLLASVRTNLPGLMILKTGDVVLVRAVSLLAIHTSVGTGICWYHIATYRLMEPVGMLRNPISKLPSDEMMVSPSLRDWVEVIDRPDYRAVKILITEGNLTPIKDYRNFPKLGVFNSRVKGKLVFSHPWIAF
nr:hypothetical protein B456_002G078300 [Ipomoea batatas]